MKMTPKVASSFLAGLLLVGCSASDGKHNSVTVYVSADEQIAREVFSAFTIKTGIEVEWVGDTESSKNTSLVQRLIREKDRVCLKYQKNLTVSPSSRDNVLAVQPIPDSSDVNSDTLLNAKTPSMVSGYHLPGSFNSNLRKPLLKNRKQHERIRHSRY